MNSSNYTGHISFLKASKRARFEPGVKKITGQEILSGRGKLCCLLAKVFKA